MAKRQEDAQKTKIKNMEDVDSVVFIRENNDMLMRLDEFAMNEKYDLFDIPEHLRYQLIGRLLEWAYETYRLEHYKKYKKTVSQNSFALQVVGIDNQLFSTHKTGTRRPGIDSLERYAEFFGPVIWDIAGIGRRMPRDKHLIELVDIYIKADDRFRAEMVERARNYLDNVIATASTDQ